MKLNGKSIGLLLAGLVLLPGCMRVPSYKPKSLQSISSDFTYRGVEKSVVLQAQCLTKDEVYFLFGDRAKELLESVEVIHVSVHNLSTEDYILFSDAMSIIQIPYSDILRSIQTRSTDHLKKAGKVGGAVYGTLSALTLSFFAPKMIFSTHYKSVLVGFYCCTHAMGVVWPIVAGLTVLPFIGKAIKSAIMNGRINKDLHEKMLHKDVIIKSGEKYEGLIFVKKADYRPHFTIDLINQLYTDNKIVFDVDLLSIEIPPCTDADYAYRKNAKQS